MKYSLISRDWIADCVEVMYCGYSGVSALSLLFLSVGYSVVQIISYKYTGNKTYITIILYIM